MVFQGKYIGEEIIIPFSVAFPGFSGLCQKEPAPGSVADLDNWVQGGLAPPALLPVRMATYLASQSALGV